MKKKTAKNHNLKMKLEPSPSGLFINEQKTCFNVTGIYFYFV